MIKKFFIITCLLLPLETFAHTLLIVMKKYGETEMNVTHLYVQDAGLNSLGDYVIRFENGQELSLGKPTDFQTFKAMYVDDGDTISR